MVDDLFRMVLLLLGVIGVCLLLGVSPVVDSVPAIRVAMLATAAIATVGMFGLIGREMIRERNNREEAREEETDDD